ncbi:MAG: hypothetical protein ACUVUS_04625 [Thermoproteota archaeon]
MAEPLNGWILRWLRELPGVSDFDKLISAIVGSKIIGGPLYWERQSRETILRLMWSSISIFVE